MMFLVIFGSLAAAMAVVAQGNMRSAQAGMQVSRAMSAAETGLVFGALRLERAAEQFVVDRGVIDEDFAERLWNGGPYLPQHGSVESPGGSGYGIVNALEDKHLQDEHTIIADPGDQLLPSINEFGTLRTRPIALDADENSVPLPGAPHFRLKYEILTDGNVRVTSQGVDGDIRRTLQMDFSIVKRIEYAVISPNRIMIGKNVLVEGPIGSLYGTKPGELGSPNSHPLRMHSDFYHLNPSLDNQLDQFFEAVTQYDVDGDGRLRPHHPVEGAGVASLGVSDMTGDGYVDEFDLFLAHYGNGPEVVYDADLAGGSANFSDDPQLGRLIDLAIPDRDGDGEITYRDTLLGYKDGKLNVLDRYAKVRGHLMFAITRDEWESAHNGFSYQEVVQGPIRPGPDQVPVRFGVGPDELREITTDMFNDSHSWFRNKAMGGLDFEGQVQAQGGTVPSSETIWEGVPYGSPAPYDYFERPVYENMTFTDVLIPKGTNALFKNCTFIGVTYIETATENGHANWNVAGSLEPHPTNPNIYVPRFPDLHAEYEGVIVTDTKTHSNNIRFHDCTFLGSISGDRPLHYTHWRNKVQMTGETRFYLDPDDDDLALQPDASNLQSILNSFNPNDVEEMAKSSILMPGWSMDVGSFTSDPFASPEDTPIIKLRGTIVAGILDIRGSADVHGTLLMTFRPENGKQPLMFNPSDCWSCLASFSTTIGYFGPEFGDYEGLAFDDDDFDGFGEIRLRYDPDAKLPDGIPWPIQVDALHQTYTEGGEM
ncbi:MAG: hypothetical protein EA377_08150 [Phycisphaerales bacterium]|nr:MAG: hypothetical protein EA377_08150 [Phycisphaerales bacterium]